MIRSSTQPLLVDVERIPRQQSYLAKSNLMTDILTGGHRSQTNSHFIDSLQRFRKDYATCDKQQRQREREKRMKILEERKNQQIQRESRLRRNQIQYDQENMNKINQSRYLCEIGMKKTGISNGMPMNPITLQYHQNPFGNQQRFNDDEEKLKKLVRAHHIQNASTSGYNPINGQNLPTIEPLVPKNTQGRLEQKLGQFYQTKKLDPNIDLQLNPKNMLPKYVGEIDHYNQSPIKGHNWQGDEQQFQTAYQSQFNQHPHPVTTNSRIQQPVYYQPMMEQNNSRYQQQPYYNQSRQRQNDQNINPYMKDSAYMNQVYEMKR